MLMRFNSRIDENDGDDGDTGNDDSNNIMIMTMKKGTGDKHEKIFKNYW